MLRRALALLLAPAMLIALLPAAGATASAGTSCALWTDPAGDAVPAASMLDLRAGAATLGSTGPRFVLTLANLPAAGSSLLAPGAAAVSWEMRWSYAGTLYYAAARATAAQPDSATYDVGTVQHSQEVPAAAASGILVPGALGTIAIDVPAAAVGSPAAGVELGAPVGQVRVVDSTGSTTLADQGGPGAAYRLGGTCAAPASAGPATSSPAAAGSGGAPDGQADPAGAADGTGLTTLGDLQLPQAASHLGAGANGPVPFPISGNRAYYTYQPATGNTHVLEYDLTPKVPRLVADVDSGQFLGSFNYGKDMRAIDTADGVALFLNWGATGSQIIPIDLSTLKAGAPWDLSTSAPGFIANGITYSSEDHRAYLVGEIGGNQSVTGAGLTNPDYHAAVVSFDPRSQTVDWMRVLTGCSKMLNTFEDGTVVVRSHLQPALYFACWQGSLAGAPGQIPGSASVVRLWIKPGATQVDALSFPEDVFPISGQYVTAVVSGTAAFDYGTDRFFLLSQSYSTPGAWVLDGASSSWAGFVSSPDPCDLYLAVDSNRGELLIAADTYLDNSSCTARRQGWLLVTDGRQLPPPEGVLTTARYASAQIVVDPATHRFFLEQNRATDNQSRDYAIQVVQDVAPPPPPPAPLDYDALTSDVPEGPGTESEFAGDARGFGARALLVGGTGALVANTTCNLTGTGSCGISGIENGDRGMYWAQAGGLDLRSIGASSGGQALEPDQLTANDLVTQSGGAVTWPWSAVACLDAGGGKQTSSESGPGASSAAATCDLAGRSVSFDGSAAGADPGTGVTIAHESVSSRVWIDPKAGTLTDTEAMAQGIELIGPSGEVRIGRIVSEAKTAAHGRHGSASATLTQVIEQVTVLDGSGNVLLSCAMVGGPGCDATTVAGAANGALDGVMRITLPSGVTTATPHGAFAEVRKSDVDFYNDETVNDDTSYEVPALQIVVFNDGQERSRLLVQVAGVQASSIYEVHAPQPFVSDSLPAPLPVLSALPAVSIPPSESVAARRLLVRTVHHFTDELGILFRSPLQALGFLLLMSLFGLAGYVAWRRRELAGVITEGAVR